ncbi:endonuclease NucS domain-containing protein [Burkholderia sp. KBS0801]|uniref:endonuclease NucS domain-containing protein n=1 Tax=Burkholderia sp. KBS0801 TaxID=1179675 RepID=UPI001643D11F|nr:endonuclease NucS domain-containing protein [Burkholderia sp. KBS0801]
MSESELRDLIARDVSVLESGLTLLNKEQYIPNLLGTRSYIDLYARDRDGHHVLIELKRSNAAARDAIHEIHKYVEGVKQHFGARDDEIRVFVASTEWKELTVPFSRFATDTAMSVTGLQIHVDEVDDISVTRVPVLPMSQGRFIAPWHDVNWYSDEDGLKKGLASIDACCQAKGIVDYIVIVLRPPKPIHSEHQAKMRASLMQIATMQGLSVRPGAEVLPTYGYIAYFAMHALSASQYMAILKRDASALEEADNVLGGMDDEEALQYLNESVSALEPRPDNDHYEIGYPAKFSKYLDGDQCNVEVVRRYGMFERNTLLTDDDIISEVRGEDGATGQRFKRTLNVANRAHMAAARTDIARCLDQNPAWKSHVLRALEDIEREFPEADIKVSIFNPATGIFTPYLVATREEGLLFLPTYHVIVHNPEPSRMYFGALQANGSALTFKQLLNKYYDGRLDGLLMTMTWGGYESRDADIVEDFGASYRSFRFEIKERKFFSFRDDRWRSADEVHFIGLANEYFEKNAKLVNVIVGKIAPRESNGIFDSSSTELILDGMADLTRGLQEQQFFGNPPEECDICSCPLSEEKYMVDGAVQSAGGAWACMCGDCFVTQGKGLGLGVGQLYLRHADAWLKVAG